MSEFKLDSIYQSKEKDYSFTYAKITAIGKKNLCFDYSKDLDDLNKGICVEGSASFEDFLSHYEPYVELPKKISLYRYLVKYSDGSFDLSEWNSNRKQLDLILIKEFIKEIEL